MTMKWVQRLYTAHCNNLHFPVRSELVEGSMCFDKLSTNGLCRFWRFLVYTDLKAVTEVVNRGEIYKFLEKPWDDAALLETLREAFRLYEARRAGWVGV